MNHKMNHAVRGFRANSKNESMMMSVYGDFRPARQAAPKRHWADPVVTFTNGKQATGHNHSDRLWEADIDKYNSVSQRLFGDQSQLWWDSRTPVQVEMFLREYFDNPKLELVEIQKMYNRMNGGPVWGFGYRI